MPANDDAARHSPRGNALGRQVRSFGYAFRGIYLAFRSERNFRIHVAATCIAVAAGLYVGLSLLEWGLVVLAIGLVLAAELVNTALERLADAVSEGKHSRAIGDVKDISAAAVLLCAIAALAIGVLILLVPLVHKLAALL